MTTVSQMKLTGWQTGIEMNRLTVRRKRLSLKAITTAKSNPRLKPKETVTEDDIWVREALYHRLPTY